jgi:hypothetical protein
MERRPYQNELFKSINILLNYLRQFGAKKRHAPV